MQGEKHFVTFSLCMYVTSETSDKALVSRASVIPFTMLHLLSINLSVAPAFAWWEVAWQEHRRQAGANVSRWAWTKVLVPFTIPFRRMDLTKKCLQSTHFVTCVSRLSSKCHAEYHLTFELTFHVGKEGREAEMCMCACVRVRWFVWIHNPFFLLVPSIPLNCKGIIILVVRELLMPVLFKWFKSTSRRKQTCFWPQPSFDSLSLSSRQRDTTNIV